MHDQLQPFAGDLHMAAEFSMRLTAIRLRLLIGPSEPSIEAMFDATLWRDNGLETKECSTPPAARKSGGRFGSDGCRKTRRFQATAERRDGGRKSLGFQVSGSSREIFRVRTDGISRESGILLR
jgi:hypothetical protein